MNHQRDVAHQRLKSHVVQSQRSFFVHQGFEEVFTPLKVKEVNTEPHIEYYRVGSDYLIASPELAMKEYLFQLWEEEPQAQPKIFQTSPVFRNGEDEASSLHSSEYLMTEYYHPCENLENGIEFFDQLVRSVFENFHSYQVPTLETFTVAEAFYQRTGLHLDPHDKKPLVEAIKKFNPRSSCEGTWNDLFFEVYVCAIEPWLQLQEYCVLTGFPRSITSMARPQEKNNAFVDRFEVLFRGVELCNGYIETFQPEIIRRQMKEDATSLSQKRGLPVAWLEQLERHWHQSNGKSPSMCGVALGVERLCLMLTQHQKKGIGDGIQSFLW